MLGLSHHILIEFNLKKKKKKRKELSLYNNNTNLDPQTLVQLWVIDRLNWVSYINIFLKKKRKKRRRSHALCCLPN